MAEGRFAEAVGAFNQAGAITWTDRQEEARSALVAAWTRDAAAHPGATRFVFAYTNRDVDALNAELRQVKRARGELTGRDVQLETKHGRAAFAIGDRVQLTDTDKKRHIANGHVGTITRLNPATGEITAVLDAAGKAAGREVTWLAAEFQAFRHGYAGTIYKGQGKTLDRTYLYHTEHWRAAASYVALTRQRENAEVFVARETARDVGQLARQMARGEVRSASIAWVTRDELAAEQKRDAERDARAHHLQDALTYHQRQRERAVEQRAAEPRAPEQGQAPERTQAPASPARTHTPERIPPLLPAWRDPTGQGRDSLGRGLDAESVLAAVAGDGAVQRERQALADYLGGAYRDPKAVQAALQAAIGREGVDAVARQIARDPGHWGELRGKAGWLASTTAKQERAGAERAASAIPDSLRRLEAVSGHGRRAYTGSVEAQKERDAVEIPGLSRPALDVLRGVQEARAATERAQPGESRETWQRRREEAVAAAWSGGRADPRVAAELDGFMQAATKRLGDEGVRMALCAGGGEGRLTLPGIGREHQAAGDELARRIGQATDGSRFSQAWEQRVARETQESERVEERQTRRLLPNPEEERDGQRQSRWRGNMGR